MDSIDQISASINKILKPLFTDKVTGAVISLIIVLYAGLAAPKLPKSISSLFKQKTFKLVVLFFIAYSASNNASIAIISAVALVVSMQTLTKQEETEAVIHKIEEVVEEKKAVAQEIAAIEAAHQKEDAAEKARVERNAYLKGVAERNAYLKGVAERKAAAELPVEVVESTEEDVEEDIEEDNETEQVVESDDYNVRPIDDSSSYGQVIEEFTKIGGCAGTRYGCCADGKTAASSANDDCKTKVNQGQKVDGSFTISNMNQGNQVGGCAGTRYGCCADGKTTASSANDDCKGKHFVYGTPQNTKYH